MKKASIRFIIFLTLLISCTEEQPQPADNTNPETPTQENTGDVPILQTTIITNIAETYASSGGVISSIGNSPLKTLGVCWNTSPNPTVHDMFNSGNQIDESNFTAYLTYLLPNTTYYVRAYAINENGVGYGDELVFKTLETNTIITPKISDIEGNEYETIKIGSQTWLKQNLRTTKYNDGTNIPLAQYHVTWQSLTNDAYAWQEQIPSKYREIYGAIYNWDALNTGKLCPTGWHVPSIDEWSELIEFAGGETIAGGTLKEAGSMHWKESINKDIIATNSTGFTAVPGSERSNTGIDYGDYYQFGVGSLGVWWSSSLSENNSNYSESVKMYSGTNIVTFESKHKNSGLSVRCIKD